MVVMTALTISATACGGGGSGANGKLQVVTTVSPITNMVANVAGKFADVVGVVPEGTNSHTFEPAPSVAELLSNADAIFVNGLRLEDPTYELASKHRKDDALLVKVGDNVLKEDQWLYDSSFPKKEGKPNPHLWTDPSLASQYVGVIATALSTADPDHAVSFRANANAYRARLGALDEAIRTATATIAPDKRKLLTYHDAYAYFARTYGWTVIGAIQVESFEDPTPKEVADLIEQVKREGVPAIFGSEVFPSPVLEQIGREAGVRYVDELRDDDLPGKPGDADHSFLGLMRFDFVTMVEALGGDASALKALDVADIAKDNARYPQ